MNSGLRIVKHGKGDGLRSSPIGEDKKTHRQNDGDIVSTVKKWIAELEQRKRAHEDRRASGFK